MQQVANAPYQIIREPLDAREIIDQVAAADCGAISVFIGTVRNHARGRSVLYLEYEAYDEMALKKMAEIGEEMKRRWGVERIAIIHRAGRVEIGEASVIIAVASPHRREALEACDFGIETLKKTVPIWKKEVWEDGEVWIGEGA